MVSSPLAVPAVTIPIVPEHGGSGMNRLKKFVLDLFCLGSLRLSNAYRGVVMTRVVLRLALLALLFTPRAATAQDPRQSAPGQFDFYVLSLSWSPILLRWRCRARRPQRQCAVRAATLFFRRSWAVADAGAAADFQRMGPPRHLFRPIATRLFRDVRKARAVVKIPPKFTDLKEPLSVTPHAVEEAFVKANPGLSASAMAIGCDARRLTEVRLCLSKDLHFRDCAEIAKRSCRRAELTMPPMRGG